jgi:predicted Zn-ribbon and HTH transcriptional regulator
MSQEEVIKVLKKSKEPLSRGDIAKCLNEDAVKISHILQKLLKYNDIKCIELDRYQAMAKYNCQRRIRVYYF